MERGNSFDCFNVPGFPNCIRHDPIRKPNLPSTFINDTRGLEWLKFGYQDVKITLKDIRSADPTAEAEVERAKQRKLWNGPQRPGLSSHLTGEAWPWPRGWRSLLSFMPPRLTGNLPAPRQGRPFVERCPQEAHVGSAGGRGKRGNLSLGVVGCHALLAAAHGRNPGEEHPPSPGALQCPRRRSPHAAGWRGGGIGDHEEGDGGLIGSWEMTDW